MTKASYTTQCTATHTKDIFPTLNEMVWSSCYVLRGSAYYIRREYMNFLLCRRVSKSVFSPLNFSYLSRHNLAEELSLLFQTLVIFLKFALLLFLNWKISDRIPFLHIFLRIIHKVRNCVYSYKTLVKLLQCQMQCLLQLEEYTRVEMRRLLGGEIVPQVNIFFFTLLLHFHCPHYILPNEAVIL